MLQQRRRKKTVIEFVDDSEEEVVVREERCGECGELDCDPVSHGGKTYCCHLVE